MSTVDNSLDALFTEAGANRTEIDAQIEAEQNKARQDSIKAMQDREEGMMRAVRAENLGMNTLNTVAGVGAGAIDILKNTYNGAVSVLDAAENYAASKGIGSGDLISEANKWQGDPGASLKDTPGEVSRQIVNYAGPLLATIGSGGSFVLGTGVNAAYNFLAIDPKSARLSDMLKGTAVADYPIAHDVIDFLRTKPTDSEIEARTKNMLEGLGIDAALGGLLAGSARTYKAIAKARNPKELAAVAKNLDAAENAVKNPKPVTPKEEAVIAASDAAISTPAPKAPAQPASNPVNDEAVKLLNAMPQAELHTKLGIHQGMSENQVTTHLDLFEQLTPESRVKVLKGETDFRAALQKDGLIDAPTNTGTLTDEEKMAMIREASQKAREGVAPARPTLRIVRPEDTPEQVAQFEKQWQVLDPTPPGVTVTPEGVVNVRLANDEIVDRFAVMMQDTKNVEMLSAPVTDADLVRAADILKNDSTVVDSLAKWTPEQGPLSDKQTLVMKMILSRADEAMGDAATFAVQNINDDAALLKFARDFETYSRINEIKRGMGREQGKALRSTQIIANLAGLGEKEAVAAIGAEGRAKLAEGLINKYGGRENLRSMAKNTEFIREMSKLSKMPNSDFAMRMGEVVSRSTWMKAEDAITKVALNGMLSSPMTSIKAFLSNAATTSKTVVDNYLEATIGALGNHNAKSLAEANAFAKAAFAGLFEAVAPAAKTIRTGVPQNTRTVRLELIDGVRKIPLQEDVYEKAGAAWVQKGGIETAIETPTRVIMGVDTYWQAVNSKGYLASEATRTAMAKGFTGAEFDAYVEAFMKNPPADVLKAADEMAATNTFAKNLTGFAEKIDEGVKSLPIPFNRVVIPFLKTNLNMVEYTVKNSPMGFLAPSVRKAISEGGRARDEALAKMLSGTVALGGLMALAEAGLISGPDTTNPEVARALKDNKTVPLGTSVKVGEKWVSIKGIEPLSTLVDIAGIISKGSGYMSPDSMDEAAQMFSAIVAETLTPDTLTENLSDLLRLTSDPHVNVPQYLAQIGTRFTPYGGALTDIRQTVDPTIRSTRALQNGEGATAKLKEFGEILKNRLANQVPFFSKDLPAERNLWGEKLVLPDGLGPDAISPFATTTQDGLALKQSLEWMDDYYEMNRGTAAGLTKFNVAMPKRSIPNPMASVQYDLTPKEYSAYTLLNAGINPTTGEKLLGKTLKEATTEVFKKHDALGKKPSEYTPENYFKIMAELSQVFSTYRSVADKMIITFGDVQEKMLNQAKQAKSFEDLSAQGGQ